MRRWKSRKGLVKAHPSHLSLVERCPGRRALGDAVRRWSEKDYGVARPIMAVDSTNRHSRSEAGASQRLHRMVFADDLILVEKDDREVQDMYRDLCAAIKPRKFLITEAKLALWNNCGGPSIPVGKRRMSPEEDMMFLGVKLAREKMAAPNHRAEAAWAKIWSIKKHPTTKAVPTKARRLRLRAEISPQSCCGGAQHDTSGRTPSRQSMGRSTGWPGLPSTFFAPRTRLGWTGRNVLGAELVEHRPFFADTHPSLVDLFGRSPPSFGPHQQKCGRGQATFVRSSFFRIEPLREQEGSGSERSAERRGQTGQVHSDIASARTPVSRETEMCETVRDFQRHAAMSLAFAPKLFVLSCWLAVDTAPSAANVWSHLGCRFCLVARSGLCSLVEPTRKRWPRRSTTCGT